jgi:plasmid stabilization system protein ParE
MRVVFLEPAARELQSAVRYYELELAGLGQQFKQEVRRAVRRITEYPEAWSIERDSIRRCLLHRFPYKLLYAIRDQQIIVLAVAHQHRKPDYWVEKN